MSARSGGILEEACHAGFGKALSPPQHFRPTDPKFLSKSMIGLAVGGPEDDASAKCSPLRRLPAPDKGSKKVMVLLAKGQSWSSLPHAVSIAGLSLIVTLYMIHNTSRSVR